MSGADDRPRPAGRAARVVVRVVVLDLRDELRRLPEPLSQAGAHLRAVDRLRVRGDQRSDGSARGARGGAVGQGAR